MSLGGIISGGVLGLGGSIFGGAKASQAIRKQKKRIRAKQQDNQNWFDRRYNEDATQRADAQRMLTRLQENIKNRNQAAQGQAAMMGGTDEALARLRNSRTMRRWRMRLRKLWRMRMCERIKLSSSIASVRTDWTTKWRTCRFSKLRKWERLCKGWLTLGLTLHRHFNITNTENRLDDDGRTRE